MLQFPTKELSPEQKQAIKEQEERQKRIQEADERVNKGKATEEDLDLYVEEFLTIIDALDEGKLEFLDKPKF